MLGAVGKVLAGVAGPVVDYLTTRAQLTHQRAVRRMELEAAVHEAQVTAAREGRQLEAEWERLSIGNSGWKDEYWTVALSVPLILCFFPGWAPVILAGFGAVEQAPEWYRYSVGVAIAAAFGVRPLVNIVRRRE